MGRRDKDDDDDEESDQRLKAASEGSERMCAFEDNFKASRRIGDSESAKHWAGAFGSELFKKD